MQNLHKSNNIIVFQGISNLNLTTYPEHQLPIYLSRYVKVICFEYPQFKKLFLLLLKKIPLIEFKSAQLVIFHSFGILPFGRSFSIINKLNHVLNFFILNKLIQEKYKKMIIVSFTPELIYILSMLKKPVRIIYNITDELSTLPWWSNKLQLRQLLYINNKMTKIADKIITISPTLYSKYHKLHKNVVYIPAPINFDLFNIRKIKTNFIPPEIKNIPQPIVGMVGTFYYWRINFKLVLDLINKFRRISFVIIGPKDIKNQKYERILFSKPNLYYLGVKKNLEIPYYLQHFKICVIPYLLNLHIRSTYPTKTYEYLAMGKPVVTTAIPALKNLGDRGLIYWSKDGKEFIKKIKVALNEVTESKLTNLRIEEAKHNDWNKRIMDLMKIIETK